MTLPKYGYKYMKSSTRELRNFIEAKMQAGQAGPANTSKAALVRKLREIDMSMTFRFMDLPPEMRNFVYECLLIHDASQPESFATTGILRVNRQMYKEGRSILLAESALHLNASFGRRTTVSGIVNGDIGSFKFRSDALGLSLLDTRMQLLQNANNFCIELSYRMRNDGITNVRDLLYFFLKAFGKACPHAKNVTVKFVQNYGRRDFLAQMLSPLMSLPEECTLKLEGLSEQEEAELWSIAPSG